MSYIYPQRLILIVAFALGAIAANLYYAQPILLNIAESIGLNIESAGLIVTLMQAGYGIGVLLLVPLGDTVNIKALVLWMVGAATLGVAGLAFADVPWLYFVIALLTGIGASCVQVMVPYISQMVKPEERGKAMGTLMCGLMLGIMLSRPLSSALTEYFPWSSVFWFSAAVMLITFILLMFNLPNKKGTSTHSYPALLHSMWGIFKAESVLRRRAFYQACMFSAFCLFWTASPLYLIDELGYSHKDVALFSLVAVSGAIVAPMAGRLGDKGLAGKGTFVAKLVVACTFFLSMMTFENHGIAFVFLLLAGILIDAGVSANLVFSQKVVFSLAPEIRSRLNAMFVASIFIGGAIGSALGAYAYAQWGWATTAAVGGVIPCMGLILFCLTEKKTALQSA